MACGGDEWLIINYAAKVVQTKLVYFGPAMSGKTTSLRALFRMLNRDVDLTSIETTTGRTLFFDFGTLDFKGSEWTIKLYLYSTTGQDFYRSTRPATLHGVDGIVFIVDSKKELLLYNVLSWKELTFFFKERFKDLPIVICLNKYDIEDKVEAETIMREFQINQAGNIHLLPSIATEGKGVKEAFTIVMETLFPNFKLDLDQ